MAIIVTSGYHESILLGYYSVLAKIYVKLLGYMDAVTYVRG